MLNSAAHTHIHESLFSETCTICGESFHSFTFASKYAYKITSRSVWLARGQNGSHHFS